MNSPAHNRSRRATSPVRRTGSAGFTIVEIIATIVILAIALVGVAGIVRLGTQQSGDVMQQTRAVALGQAYLDEILGRRFDELSSADGTNPCYGLDSDPTPDPPRPCTEIASFGPDSGEGGPFPRGRFDDVDDYHGWAEGSGESAAIRDAEGNTRDQYNNFHVSITVEYAGADAAWGSLHATHAKRITVQITLVGQDAGWQFSAYKGNY